MQLIQYTMMDYVMQIIYWIQLRKWDVEYILNDQRVWAAKIDLDGEDIWKWVAH